MVFNHPLKKEQITEENFKDVADDLFFGQLEYAREYFSRVIEHGYGDDDTDYLRTTVNAIETLMDIGYDGSHRDLIDFLFMSRTEYGKINNRFPMEPLHYIDSAGGLSDELQEYSSILHEQEESSH